MAVEALVGRGAGVGAGGGRRSGGKGGNINDNIFNAKELLRVMISAGKKTNSALLIRAAQFVVSTGLYFCIKTLLKPQQKHIPAATDRLLL